MTSLPAIQPRAQLDTWFRIGGGCARFAVPTSPDQLRLCLAIDPDLRILGDGANLLVDDDGVDELVVSTAALSRTEIDPVTGRVFALAGAKLQALAAETVRLGLAGLEGLAGVPASVGGAIIMNAGGRFGQIADVVTRIHALDRSGRDVTLERAQIPFEYRSSGLSHLIVTAAELQLRPDDPAALRDRFKDVMAQKKLSQPLAANSAGCCFKNPTLRETLVVAGETLGLAGQRCPAGLLIDRAGLKGLRVGGAAVSDRHANFVVTDQAAAAREVIDLMNLVVRRVHAEFGVTLHREVVVWSRREEAPLIETIAPRRSAGV